MNGYASPEALDCTYPYIQVNASKLPMKVAEFCEEKWSEFGFDYDPTSYFLWPLDDRISADVVMSKINATYPQAAKIVKKSVSTAHNIPFSWDESEDSSGEDVKDLNFEE